VNKALDAEIDIVLFNRAYAPYHLTNLVDPKNLPRSTGLRDGRGVEGIGNGSEEGVEG
jgi:hypothetical protein